MNQYSYSEISTNSLIKELNEKKKRIQHSLQIVLSRVVLCFLSQTRKGQDTTVLEIDSPRSELLPIIDVSASDIGNNNQKFGFQIGPVCFNG